jgi:RNA polymerase sigma-70 factor (ECF subfamily)
MCQTLFFEYPETQVHYKKQVAPFFASRSIQDHLTLASKDCVATFIEARGNVRFCGGRQAASQPFRIRATLPIIGGMWPDTSQTEAILVSARQGDQAAVNRLLERHRASLRKLVQLRLDKALARRIDASDIVQDVLLEANGRLEEYLRDPKMPFHLWLRHLAKDRIIDMHRQHRGAQRRSLDREQPLASPAFSDQSSFDLAAQLKDNELTPAAASIRKELEARFLAALETMEEEDREILLMRHFEQLGNTETAEALGLSPAAAGMRHLRALRRLRAILGERPSENIG